MGTVLMLPSIVPNMSHKIRRWMIWPLLLYTVTFRNIYLRNRGGNAAKDTAIEGPGSVSDDGTPRRELLLTTLGVQKNGVAWLLWSIHTLIRAEAPIKATGIDSDDAVPRFEELAAIKSGGAVRRYPVESCRSGATSVEVTGSIIFFDLQEVPVPVGM